VQTYFSLAITLHLLAAVVWVGGMFFAYMALRPAAQTLEPSIRLPLWARTFAYFFPWVWVAVLLLLVTGYWMIFAAFGGFTRVGVYVHIMQALGIIMIMIYLHIFFALYRRMKLALITHDFIEAGKRLGQIRKLIALNLSLGLITIIVAIGGKNWGLVEIILTPLYPP
jgi:uncharacterized membrane protein